MNFIKEYIIDDINLCDEIINIHKNSNDKKQGSCGKNGQIQLTKKKSTDVCIDPNSNNLSKKEIIILEKYFKNLQSIMDKYIKEFNFCNKGNPLQTVETFNIQYYKPNEGFFEWHCERSGITHLNLTRHLVWMTYLNDLTDEGGTEFYYQKLKVKPQKGKTVIFPVDWTHTHRGVVSKTQDKYIITGWLNYINVEK